MAFVAPPLTENEYAYLTALAASSTPTAALVPAANIHTDLQEFFRLCRLPWVADFLFNTHMNSLPALTAPANMRAAISCTVQMSNVQCISLAEPEFDFHLTGGCVFVPSFSVSAVSVGFGVQECFSQSCVTAKHLHPGICDDPSLTHLRYARDDSNGTLIIVHKDPRYDLLKVESMTQVSASVRHRTFAVFNHEQFIKAINTDYTSFNPSRVATALRFINSSVETRDCPKCSLPSPMRCGCASDALLPKHPLDFSSMTENMSAFIGSYEGICRSSILEDGIERSSANVGCVVQINGEVDDDLIARLSRWAITDHLKDQKDSPTAMIMPAPGADYKASDENDMVVDTNDIEQVSAALSCSTSPAADLFAHGTSSCSSGSGILISETLDSSSPPLVVPEQPPPSASQIFDAVSRTMGPVDQNEMHLVNQITEDAQIAESFFDVGTDDAHLEQSFSTHSQDAPTGVPSMSTFETQVAANAAALRNKIIAPSAPVELRTETEQNERERRAQLRKQRNREAAQRSNLKRKIKNDSLKQALKDIHAKAAELRAKELQLREENLELRKLTSS